MKFNKRHIKILKEASLFAIFSFIFVMLFLLYQIRYDLMLLTEAIKLASFVSIGIFLIILITSSEYLKRKSEELDKIISNSKLVIFINKYIIGPSNKYIIGPFFMRFDYIESKYGFLGISIFSWVWLIASIVLTILIHPIFLLFLIPIAEELVFRIDIATRTHNFYNKITHWRSK